MKVFFDRFGIHYSMLSFIMHSFSSCVWLAILLVAFCPLLEGKIAIPLALNNTIWMGGELSPLLAFGISFVGSSLPCLFLVPIVKKLKNRTTGFVLSKFTNKYLVKANKMSGFKTFQKCLTLCGFSSLPLPLTGVWSSSIIAGLLELKIGYSIISILLGNMISCGLILLLCSFLSNSIGNIFMVSISLVIVFALCYICAGVIEKAKQK